MGDIWISNFDRLEKLADEIFADVNERNRMNRGNIPSAKLTASIKRKIQQLTGEMALLSEELEKLQSNSRITQKEFGRRQDLLEGLLSRRDRLVSMSKSDGGDKESLFSGFSGSSFGDSAETKELDNTQLVNLQKKKMQDQDKHIDLISDSIGRQNEVAVKIGDELDVHTALLDDMSGGVRKTSDKVQDQNVKIMKHEDQVKLFGCWVGLFVQSLIVIILIILLIYTNSS